LTGLSMTVGFTIGVAAEEVVLEDPEATAGDCIVGISRSSAPAFVSLEKVTRFSKGFSLMSDEDGFSTTLAGAIALPGIGVGSGTGVFEIEAGAAAGSIGSSSSSSNSCISTKGSPSSLTSCD
jgi:hypothetical protein